MRLVGVKLVQEWKAVAVKSCGLLLNGERFVDVQVSDSQLF
jgi:hypothetical protein